MWKDTLAILLVFLLVLFLVRSYQKKPLFSESFSLLDPRVCKCGCLQQGRFRQGCRCQNCPFRKTSGCSCGCLEQGRKVKTCTCPRCPYMIFPPVEPSDIEGFTEHEVPRESIPSEEEVGTKDLGHDLGGRVGRSPCRLRQNEYALSPEENPQWRDLRFYLPQETLSGQDENIWVPTEPDYRV